MKALFPDRQGCRRPHRDRLRRARGRQAKRRADARPHARPLPAPAAAAALEVDDFVVDNDRLNVAGDDAFERDPVNLIRLFWLADRHNLAIHPDATRLATRSLQADRPRRCATIREANRLFLDILTSRNAPEVVLRLMNEAGVLGRFIPEFGRIVAMMQFNMYHHYTVDEHLIRSIGVLAEIDGRRLEQRASARQRASSPLDPQPPGALRGAVPARHRQGPARGPFDRRRRASPASSARASASTRPRPRRWPGWSSIIC